MMISKGVHRGPVIQPVWSMHGKDCLAACIATITGHRITDLDQVIKDAFARATQDPMHSIGLWVDDVNTYFENTGTHSDTWCLRGPIGVPPLGLGIAVVQPPDPEDMNPHAVVIWTPPSRKGCIVHDPGFAPYEFDPIAFYFIQVFQNDTLIDRGFTDSYNKAREAVSDPPF